MPWMSRNDELSLYNQITQTGRALVEVIGESVEGRDIYALYFGLPVPNRGDRATILHVGLQHGTEPAGREALLQWAEYLSTTSNPSVIEFLENNVIVIIPSVNLDGMLDGFSRTNANGVDLNRDHLELNEPETRAVAEVLGATQPAVVIDHHEASTNGGMDITFAYPFIGAADQTLIGVGIALFDAMEERAASEGWSHGEYPGADSAMENRLRNLAALRNSTSILIETLLGQTEEERTEQHYAMCEVVLEFASTVDVIQEADDAMERKTQEGITGDSPFDLRVRILSPPPVAYQLVGIVSTFHLRVFNIEMSGGIVPMGQASQPVIPFLFDELAETPLYPGIRLLEFPTPDIEDATVEDFAEFVSGSHKLAIEARVLDDFFTGNNPPGTDIPVVSGDVQFDATADIFATLVLETPGTDEYDGKSLFPHNPNDLLSIYGNEVFLRRGIRSGDDTIIWSSLGYFRIEDAAQEQHSGSSITLSASDRMSGIIDARPLAPIEFSPTENVGDVVTELVTTVYPRAYIEFDDEDLIFQSIGRTLIVEDSRFDALKEIAEAFGKIFFWDGVGVLRFQDAPDEDTPRWIVKAGENGVLVDSSRHVTRAGAYNAVAATGEAGDGDTDPIRAVADDRGALSPTRWGGPFGNVPRFFSSPLITTGPQAANAAASILRRNMGAPYNVNFGVIPNPALRPYDPIRVIQKDGTRDMHIVERVSVPLTATSTSTGSTRERTLHVIGTQIDVQSIPEGEVQPPE